MISKDNLLCWAGFGVDSVWVSPASLTGDLQHTCCHLITPCVLCNHAEDVADLAQQLDATQSQVASCCDAVRALTQTTYRRVDEHASAIQRLTAVGVCGARCRQLLMEKDVLI